MEIYTIGFSKKSAREFFETLKSKRIKLLIDIRLNNRSQLAGYTKMDDLRYFLKQICNADYLHETRLSPTPELLKAYRNKIINWKEYEGKFIESLNNSHVENIINKSLFIKPTVLLCSEHTADKCHRRLVSEYLSMKWGGLNIIHL